MVVTINVTVSQTDDSSGTNRWENAHRWKVWQLCSSGFSFGRRCLLTVHFCSPFACSSALRFAQARPLPRGSFLPARHIKAGRSLRSRPALLTARYRSPLVINVGPLRSAPRSPEASNPSTIKGPPWQVPSEFRHSLEGWSEQRVHDALYQPLDANLGATQSSAWFSPPPGYEARRLEMDNGDLALFSWSDDDAYWLGNTETPETLWRTDKCTFEEAPYPVTRWAQRELLAQRRGRPLARRLRPPRVVLPPRLLLEGRPREHAQLLPRRRRRLPLTRTGKRDSNSTNPCSRLASSTTTATRWPASSGRAPAST